MKILFVAPYTPNLIRTRPLNLVKGLAAEGHRVTLATLWSTAAELESLRQLTGILDGLIADRMGKIHSGWNCIRAIVGSLPLQALYSWSPGLMKKISRATATNDFDVVHVEHLRGAKYAIHLSSTALAAGRNRPPLVWDSVDCISHLFRRASQHGSSRRVRLAARIELPRTERTEGRLALRFARTLVTSETDRRGLIGLADMCRRRNGHAFPGSLEERIAVIPNGVDLKYFCPGGETREPQTLVISGKMSYHANVAAVLRFVRGVMPGIWTKLPETRLWIVGQSPSPQIRSLGVDARVQITGAVDDVRPYLRKATIAVAPIQYSAGIQNKVLEAMACATPVVATPEAVKALRVQSGHHVVVEEDDQNLADAICSLIANPGRCAILGRAGRAFVEANHDWHLAVCKLIRVYENAGS